MMDIPCVFMAPSPGTILEPFGPMREAYRRVDDSKGGFGGAEGSRVIREFFIFLKSSCNHSALVQESTDGVPTNCHQKLPTLPGRPGASQVDFVEVVIHGNLRESWLI